MVVQDMRPCSSMAPQPVHRCIKIHTLPYGQPPAVLLWSLQTPFFCFFRGGLGAPLSPTGSSGRFPFPLVGVGVPTSATWKGSLGTCCPGRHATYCHGSPHVQARSADAAISIRNWMSYSSQDRWCKVFLLETKHRVEVSYHARYHLWGFLGEYCNVQREAPNPRGDVHHSTL